MYNKFIYLNANYHKILLCCGLLVITITFYPCYFLFSVVCKEF